MRATPDRGIAVVLALGAALAYLAFGWNADTSYDHYGRLAEAFVQGRWWLTDGPSWLNELVACGEGRWCVVYPPLPAILSIPFLPLGSTALAQVLASRIAGGLSAGPLYLGLRAFGVPRWVAVTGTVLSAVGTTLLFTSVDGRASYVAHSVAVLFTCVAFWLAARGGPAWSVGAAIGCAALARVPVAAAAPALALLAARRTGRPYPAVLSRILLAGAPFVLLYAGYDLLRWGSVFDAGPMRLIEGDVSFANGALSLLYLPRQLYALFLEPPDLIAGAPYFLRPHFIGMSLVLTTPAFLWIFGGLRAVRRDAAVATTALAALSTLLPSLLSGSVGQPQFGYRASLDVQPFLIALAITGDSGAAGGWRRRPSVLFLVAAFAAAAVNIYATVAILRFGYWQ